MLFRVFFGFVFLLLRLPFSSLFVLSLIVFFFFFFFSLSPPAFAFLPLPPSLVFHTTVSSKTFRGLRKTRARQSRVWNDRRRGSSSLSRSRQNFRESSQSRTEQRRRNSLGNNKSDYLELLHSTRISDVRTYGAACHRDETLRRTHSSESSRRLRNMSKLQPYVLYLRIWKGAL